MSDANQSPPLLLHDLPYDVLELIMANVAWGSPSAPPPPTPTDAAALAHPAAACTALRAAAHAVLARCTHIDLTPQRVCTSILCCSRPGPAALEAAAPTVAAVLSRTPAATAVDLGGGHAYVTDAVLDALGDAAAAGRRQLTSVRLDYCVRLTAPALARLAAAAPGL
jgi:hypothetical protein